MLEDKQATLHQTHVGLASSTDSWSFNWWNNIIVILYQTIRIAETLDKVIHVVQKFILDWVAVPTVP